MSQESGMFSVRRTREVSEVMGRNHQQFILLISDATDSRPSQQQCICDSHACICYEKIHIKFEPAPASTAYYKSRAHNLCRIANVARARSTFATCVPTLFIWGQLGCYGWSLDCTAAEHCKLPQPDHDRAEELCAGDQYAREPHAGDDGEHTKTE